jgi:dihydroorotase-like cyclic amidohydrolase
MKILHLRDLDTGEIEIKNTKYEVRNTDLFTKCGWTPFAGRRVYGKVKKVTLHGKTVFENGEFMGKTQGQVL